MKIPRKMCFWKSRLKLTSETEYEHSFLRNFSSFWAGGQFQSPFGSDYPGFDSSRKVAIEFLISRQILEIRRAWRYCNFFHRIIPFLTEKCSKEKFYRIRFNTYLNYNRISLNDQIYILHSSNEWNRCFQWYEMAPLASREISKESSPVEPMIFKVTFDFSKLLNFGNEVVTKDLYDLDDMLPRQVQPDFVRYAEQQLDTYLKTLEKESKDHFEKDLQLRN